MNYTTSVVSYQWTGKKARQPNISKVSILFLSRRVEGEKESLNSQLSHRPSQQR